MNVHYLQYIVHLQSNFLLNQTLFSPRQENSATPVCKMLFNMSVDLRLQGVEQKALESNINCEVLDAQEEGFVARFLG